MGERTTDYIASDKQFMLLLDIIRNSTKEPAKWPEKGQEVRWTVLLDRGKGYVEHASMTSIGGLHSESDMVTGIEHEVETMRSGFLLPAGAKSVRIQMMDIKGTIVDQLDPSVTVE